MLDPSVPRRPVRSTVAWVALIGIICFAALAVIAALVPALLKAVAVLFGLLVGFAICALPFATVLGIVLLITRHRRATMPAMYAAPPYPLVPGVPPGAHAGVRRGVAARVPQRPRQDPAAGLPPELRARLATVRDKIAALREPGQWALVPPEDQVHIERIDGEYLPAILETFRGVPRGTQEWKVDGGGETVINVVERQLRLLEQSLDAIAERVFKSAAAQLLAQQQFLEQRLGEAAPDDLTISPV